MSPDSVPDTSIWPYTRHAARPHGAGEDALTASAGEAGTVADRDAQVMRKLQLAASRTPQAMLTEAAALIGGSAVVRSPVSGDIYRATAPGAPERWPGTEAGDSGGQRPHARPVANTELVLVPGPGVSPRRVELVARTIEDLLMVRVQRASELQEPEMRLHNFVTRRLLRGETSLVAEFTDDAHLSYATVYRLGGGEDPAASQHAVWAAVMPAIVRQRLHTLVARIGPDLAVVALHHPGADDGRTLRLVAHAAEQYHLLGGVADPVPIDQLAVAWEEASQARAGATPATRLVPAAGLGDRALLRIMPADPLASWAAALLQPLDDTQRKTLAAWLRTGHVGKAAEALGVSRATVHVRVAGIGALLGTDLGQAGARAALQLALRAPDPVPGSPPPRREPEPTVDSFLTLAPRSAVQDWAHDLFDALTDQQSISLRVWLKHLGQTRPAANELHLQHKALTRWIKEAARALQADLGSPAVRAELYVAAVATAGSAPSELLGRAGRTYGNTPRRPAN